MTAAESVKWGVRWHAVPEQPQWDEWGFLDEGAARDELKASNEPGDLICERIRTFPVEVVR